MGHSVSHFNVPLSTPVLTKVHLFCNLRCITLNNIICILKCKTNYLWSKILCHVNYHPQNRVTYQLFHKKRHIFGQLINSFDVNILNSTQLSAPFL